MAPARLTVRRLLRGAGKAALGTRWAEGDGRSYVSMVTLATDHAGQPVLLLSRLADHTRNLLADARVSLLVEGTEHPANPQQNPRVTIIGTARQTDEPAVRARFLARHPYAGMYAGFADFGFWTVDVEKAHFVGGFARALWLEDGLLAPPEAAAALATAETGVIEHMNRDHADAVELYATGLLGLPPGPWRLSAADPDGCDLTLGETVVRLHFDQPVATPGELRAALVALAARARG